VIKSAKRPESRAEWEIIRPVIKSAKRPGSGAEWGIMRPVMKSEKRSERLLNKRVVLRAYHSEREILKPAIELVTITVKMV